MFSRCAYQCKRVFYGCEVFLSQEGGLLKVNVVFDVAENNIKEGGLLFQDEGRNVYCAGGRLGWLQ